MPFLILTKDNNDNEHKQSFLILKATTLDEALLEAKEYILDLRFWEDRDRYHCSALEVGFYLEELTVIEFSNKIEINVEQVIREHRAAVKL